MADSVQEEADITGYIADLTHADSYNFCLWLTAQGVTVYEDTDRIRIPHWGIAHWQDALTWRVRRAYSRGGGVEILSPKQLVEDIQLYVKELDIYYPEERWDIHNALTVHRDVTPLVKWLEDRGVNVATKVTESDLQMTITGWGTLIWGSRNWEVLFEDDPQRTPYQFNTTALLDELMDWVISKQETIKPTLEELRENRQRIAEALSQGRTTPLTRFLRARGSKVDVQSYLKGRPNAAIILSIPKLDGQFVYSNGGWVYRCAKRVDVELSAAVIVDRVFQVSALYSEFQSMKEWEEGYEDGTQDLAKDPVPTNPYNCAGCSKLIDADDETQSAWSGPDGSDVVCLDCEPEWRKSSEPEEVSLEEQPKEETPQPLHDPAHADTMQFLQDFWGVYPSHYSYKKGAAIIDQSYSISSEYLPKVTFSQSSTGKWSWEGWRTSSLNHESLKEACESARAFLQDLFEKLHNHIKGDDSPPPSPPEVVTKYIGTADMARGLK